MALASGESLRLHEREIRKGVFLLFTVKAAKQEACYPG